MHDAEHERWLEEVFAGGPAASSAATEERLARCAECRRIHAALAKLAAGVAAGARERDAVLELAGRTETAPGEEHAAQRLRELLLEGPARGAPAGARGRRHVWPWVAGLAAAIVLAFALVRFLAPPHAPDPGPILGAPLRLVRPIDRVERYSPFEWDTPPSGGARFELVVESYDPALRRWTEALKLHVEGTSHALAPEEEARLPARIRWRIRATRPGEPGAAVAEAEASRSP